MRKLLTTLTIVLAMALSVIGLTACKAEHTHTFADEWSVSETEHWHAATCEHTDEVKDKGEHTFNGGGTCSTCGYEKYKVTKAQWDAALEFPYTSFALKLVEFGDESSVKVSATAYSVQFDSITIFMSFEGENTWLYMPLEMMGGMSVEESGGEGEPELHYIKVNVAALGSNMPLEGLVGDMDEFRAMVKNQSEGYTAGVKDKFESATYDAEKKAYILTDIDYTFMDKTYDPENHPDGVETHVYDASYEIAFEHGKMKSFKETFYSEEQHTAEDKIEAEITGIDATTIEFPTELVEPTVTKAQYEAAFDNSIVDNVQIRANVSAESGGMQVLYEADGNLIHGTTYFGGENYEFYSDYKTENYDYYYLNNDTYNWEKIPCEFTQGEPSSAAEDIAEYKALLIDPYFAYAEDKFDNAIWLGDICVLMVDKIENLPNPMYDPDAPGSVEPTMTVYDVTYTLMFQDGKLTQMMVSGSMDQEGESSCMVMVSIGTAEITLPTIEPQA